MLAGNNFIIDIGSFGTVVPADYIPALLLGVFCALAGILLMKGVAFVEQIARKSFIPGPTSDPCLAVRSLAFWR